MIDLTYDEWVFLGELVAFGGTSILIKSPSNNRAEELALKELLYKGLAYRALRTPKAILDSYGPTAQGRAVLAARDYILDLGVWD